MLLIMCQKEENVMKLQCFSIKREYEISCKLFTPDTQTVNNVIIGVHGFAGDKDSSMLKKLAMDICQKNAALICFDFPAHGDSCVGEEMLTIENCKNDLLAVIDYVVCKYPDTKKSIFATSFGGFITLLSADKLTNFTLVLRAPAVTMQKLLLDNVLKISAEDFKRENVVECGFERPIKLPYSFYEELLQQENLFNKQFILPILIIHGNRDDIVLLDDVAAFVKLQKNTRLEIIQGADHRFKNTGELEKIVDLTTRFIGI